VNPEHAAWLALTTEDALEPDLEICDPHHHLWDHPKERYEVAELHADTGAGHNVTRTVFVDCMSGYRDDLPPHLAPVGETEYALAQAREAERRGGARIAGIVSFADLSLGRAVEEPLSAHVEAGAGLFRGIRHATGWDPDPSVHNSHTNPPQGLMGEPAFREGLATLASMGLSFDAWLYHPQLPELVDLARAHPEATIVLDHLGAPLGTGPYAGRRDEVLAAWRPPMAELAQLPNVYLKVGGIGMALYGMGFHRLPRPPGSAELAAAWGDLVRWCIDAFGPSRCMFESNFPVDRRSCSYVVLWNAFKRMASEYGAPDKAELFSGTARRAYRLG
jgi:L-fuconolactonase